MDIKIFIKSLSESEHKELLNYVINHENFEIILLEKAKNYNNMLLSDWMSIKNKELSVRLFNGLYINFINSKNRDLFSIKLSEVNFDHFYNGKNLGQKSWNEFQQLRGY